MSMLREPIYKKRQAALLTYILNHRDQKFKAEELRTRTYVPKMYVRRLLEGRPEVCITEKPAGRYTYQAAASPDAITPRRPTILNPLLVVYRFLRIPQIV